jgi:hypothetical protein
MAAGRGKDSVQVERPLAELAQHVQQVPPGSMVLTEVGEWQQ